VNEPANLQDIVPPEPSIPAAPLESILCTDELRNRPGRPPDYAKENSALAALVGALADSPATILQTLADKALEVLDADSAGLSLLTKDGRRFYWAAIAGAWHPHLGGGTPRDFGPCGDVLDRNITMLFTHWERRYPYLSSAMPLAEEGLLVPFYVNGKSVGTIWAIAHRNHRKFDSEDQRLLESMGRFASAAYQTVESIEELKSEIAAREKAQTELRELTDSLEAQVRARTQELERSEASMAEAQRLSHTGSSYLNVRTGEVLWSPEFFDILGFDPENTKPSYSLHLERVHPDDRSRFQQVRSAAIEAKKDYNIEYRLLLPSGAIRDVHAIGHCVENKSGDVEYTASVMDVTQRRLAEEALHTAQTALAHANRVATLGEISASIAHEVNQPIGAAIAYANAALNWLGPQRTNLEEARRALGLIVEANIRAGEVIDRIRSLVKKAPPRRDKVDINEALLGIVELTRGQTAKNAISVQMQLAERLPAVRGDRVQLQQVILNLLINAIEAMSGMLEGSRQLVITTRETEAEGVLVAVRDVGPGVPPEIADRLFESFYTTKPGGLGMGLSISRSIIEAHGGRLWASANAPQGAIFQFTLPAYVDAGESDRVRINPAASWDRSLLT
jgi:PAS domain S-box-containing protein